MARRAYRYELKPNDRQRNLLVRHAGAARWAYNWGLQRMQEAHRINELPVPRVQTPTAIDLHRELNVLKKTKVPWLREVSKCAPQEALRDLDRAFNHFFRRVRKAGRPGYPRFKRKGARDSFRLTGAIRTLGRHVQLPRIGRVRVKEDAHAKGRILSVTVSRQADRWFASFTVEAEMPAPTPPTGPPIGVDLGINHLATLSDGRVFENPKPLRSRLSKLRRLSRQFSRTRKGSANRKKAAMRLAKLQWRIKNIRQDALHKLTTMLAKNHGEIVIEDLNVRGMARNHRVARAILDVGLGEFRRQLAYKCTWYGSKLTVVDRWYPSSKKCSACGNVKESLSLEERTYGCERCGLVMDRDLNAALNLVAASSEGQRASGETLNACGDPSAGGVASAASRHGPVRQEANTMRGAS